MELISMTDFVLEQYKIYINDTNADLQSFSRYVLRTKNYANFLKQPLKLEMFEGKTKLFSNAEIIESDGEYWIFHNNKYRFRTSSIEDMTIEDLSWSNLELTENAIKKIK